MPSQRAQSNRRRPSRRRPARSRRILRWLALGVVAFLAFLYYRPLTTYVETRRALAERLAEVRALEVEQKRLERRLDGAMSDRALTAQARKLGLARPGERIFVVKGVEEWRRAHAASIARRGEDR